MNKYTDLTRKEIIMTDIMHLRILVESLLRVKLNDDSYEKMVDIAKIMQNHYLGYENQRKYRLKLKSFYARPVFDYLVYDERNGGYYIDSIDLEGCTSAFTKYEIERIKKEYNVDLSEFEIEGVK